MSPRRSIRSLLAIATLAASLLPIPVAAQEASPPTESSPTAGIPAPASLDLVGIFPAEAGGQPWTQYIVREGPEILADLDPNEPLQAQEIALHESLLEATGATIDDVTMATSFMQEEDGSFSFVLAYQIAGADGEVIQELYLPAFAGSLEEPRTEPGQSAGRDVILLYNDARPDAQPAQVYVSGDTVWVISLQDPLKTEVFLDELP